MKSNSVIMLVDDNAIDLLINSRVITLANVASEMVSCSSAKEALDYLEKHIDEPEKLPNLILLDIQMPEMNGFDFLEQYKDLPDSVTENCSIVMLSSTLDFGDIQRAEANPHVQKLINKPLTINALNEL